MIVNEPVGDSLAIRGYLQNFLLKLLTYKTDRKLTFLLIIGQMYSICIY